MATKSKPSQIVKLEFPPTGPFALEFESKAVTKRFEANQKKSRIKTGIEMYLARIQELTQLKVPERLRSALPHHFHSPTRVLVAICEDGIALLYEPSLLTSKNEVIVWGFKQNLAYLTLRFSRGLVRITGSTSDDLAEDIQPPTIGFGAFNTQGEQVKNLVENTPFQFNFPMPQKPSVAPMEKLPHSASLIRNQFELGIEGVQLHDKANSKSEGKNFRTRGKFAFPVFWDSVALYPWADYKEWRTANFYGWAERHFFEIGFHAATTEYSWLALQSQTRLREHYNEILNKLDALLKKKGVVEEELQKFLTIHPEVLVPGYKRVLPKLSLGIHVTDFVIEDPTGHYLLIELENPEQPLFVKSGHASAKLTHAEGQVKDWVRYIQDNKNTVEKELGLTGISAQPSALIVIGRSNSLTATHRRKLQVDQGKIEIITYDDLRARFVSTIENLLGMLAHVGKGYEVTYLASDIDSHL